MTSSFGTATAFTRRDGSWWITYDKAYMCGSGSPHNAPECGPDRPDEPDGYWIVDDSHVLRTLPVAADAHLVVVPQGRSQGVAATPEQLARAVHDGGGHLLVDLQLDSAGRVVRAAQRFVP